MLPEKPFSDGDTPNVFHGTADKVVQARDIFGGVHLHAHTQTTPVPRQLPPDVIHFAGRSHHLAELDSLLWNREGPAANAVAIVVIDGMAGIGKSALAVHWAHQHLDDFPDGHLWVNLRGFDPSGEPMPAGIAVRGFLDALGVVPSATPVDLDAQVGLYRSLLAGKRMLLVLDNARSAEQVIPLLPGGAGCVVLVTSRRRLAGLVAAHGAVTLDMDILADPEARDLLARRIGGDRLAAEPDAAAALLTACAGLPLALSVVAARVAAHPRFRLADLAAELDEAATRLESLDTGELSASVEAVLSWSYDALEPQAAMMFGLMGQAPGPDISLQAAASLAALPIRRARIVLRELETASLIQEYAPGRYRMHDLVRLYAADQIRDDHVQEARTAALRRVADYYLHTAHAGDRVLVPHRQPIELDQPAEGTVLSQHADKDATLAWFDVEYPCLLAAQDMAVERGWHKQSWQLAWAMNSFHNFRGHLRTQIQTWRAGLASADQLGQPAIQALTCRSLGHAYARAGHYSEAVEYLNHAISLAEQAGDLTGQAHGHRTLARAWVLQDNYHQGLNHATRALDLLQALSNPAWEAEALNEVGLCQAHLGHLAQARASCDQSLVLARQQSDREGEGYALDNLGYIALHAGRHRDALNCYHQAFAIWHDLGHSYNQANNLDGLAKAHAALDEHDEARNAWQQALQLYQAQHRSTEATRIQQQLNTPADPRNQ